MKKLRKRRRALKPEKRGDFGGRRKSRTECHPEAARQHYKGEAEWNQAWKGFEWPAYG